MVPPPPRPEAQVHREPAQALPGHLQRQLRVGRLGGALGRAPRGRAFWVGHGVRVFRSTTRTRTRRVLGVADPGGAGRRSPTGSPWSEAFTRPAMMGTSPRPDSTSRTPTSRGGTGRARASTSTSCAGRLLRVPPTELLRRTPLTSSTSTSSRGVRPFEARLVLAATLSPPYDIFSGFERREPPPRTGSEEYLRLGEVRGQAALARRPPAPVLRGAQLDHGARARVPADRQHQVFGAATTSSSPTRSRAGRDSAIWRSASTSTRPRPLKASPSCRLGLPSRPSRSATSSTTRLHLAREATTTSGLEPRQPPAEDADGALADTPGASAPVALRGASGSPRATTRIRITSSGPTRPTVASSSGCLSRRGLGVGCSRREHRVELGADPSARPARGHAPRPVRFRFTIRSRSASPAARPFIVHDPYASAVARRARPAPLRRGHATASSTGSSAPTCASSTASRARRSRSGRRARARSASSATSTAGTAALAPDALAGRVGRLGAVRARTSAQGARYKYEIRAPTAGCRSEGRPVALAAELPPAHGVGRHRARDHDWQRRRRGSSSARAAEPLDRARCRSTRCTSAPGGATRSRATGRSPTASSPTSSPTTSPTSASRTSSCCR